MQGAAARVGGGGGQPSARLPFYCTRLSVWVVFNWDGEGVSVE